MTIVEIILLAGGVGVFIASYFVGNKKEEKDKEEVVVHNTELSEEDKAKIQEQVDGIISEKMEDVSERTEAKMDKISNTKMLELNDYAETIMNEINRNHNETVFLYDMLNEKAKEVKNTVKDVNIAKKEVNRIAAQQVNESTPKPAENNSDDNTVKQHEEVKTPAKNNAGLNNQIDSSLYNNINKTTDGGYDYGYKAPEASKDLAKERLMEIVKSASKTSQPKEDNTKADELKKAEADKAESDTKKAEEAKADNSAKKAESDKAGSSAAKASSKTAAKSTSKTTASKSAAKTASASKPRKSTAKKPANQAGELVKMASAPKAEDIVAGFDENMTNNERIVELSRQGIGNKEIAKVLNIALGEVKLIVDLHNSNSSD